MVLSARSREAKVTLIILSTENSMLRRQMTVTLSIQGPMKVSQQDTRVSGLPAF